MPRVEHDHAKVVGLRERLTKQARELLVRLDGADPHYGFGAEVCRLRQRVNDLLDGADVLVYRFEVPASMQPPRDGQTVYTLRGDRLVAAEYEGVVPAREPVDVATFWPHNALKPGQVG